MYSLANAIINTIVAPTNAVAMWNCGGVALLYKYSNYDEH